MSPAGAHKKRHGVVVTGDATTTPLVHPVPAGPEQQQRQSGRIQSAEPPRWPRSRRAARELRQITTAPASKITDPGPGRIDPTGSDPPCPSLALGKATWEQGSD